MQGSSQCVGLLRENDGIPPTRAGGEKRAAACALAEGGTNFASCDMNTFASSCSAMRKVWAQKEEDCLGKADKGFN